MDAEAKNQEILKRIAQLKSLHPAKVQKNSNYIRHGNNSLVRVAEPSTSGDFILKSNNKKLVRKGAPPIVKNVKAAAASSSLAAIASSSLANLPSVNVDDIMKKYSITQHASSVVPSEFITVKNKLVRKALLTDTSRSNPTAKGNESAEKRYCRHFARGKCNDANCKYVHDPDRIIACRQFLQTGKCDNAHSTGSISCKCIADDSCRYSHMNVSKNASICPEFSLSSWCDLGGECEKKHLNNICPEFYDKGSCSRDNKCRLKHVKAQEFNGGDVKVDSLAALEVDDEDDDDEMDFEEEDSKDDFIAF